MGYDFFKRSELISLLGKIIFSIDKNSYQLLKQNISLTDGEHLEDLCALMDLLYTFFAREFVFLLSAPNSLDKTNFLEDFKKFVNKWDETVRYERGFENGTY